MVLIHGMLLMLTFILTDHAAGNPHSTRLYSDLLKSTNYNKLIRPVKNYSDKLTVKLGLKLSQLIDVVSSTPEKIICRATYLSVGWRKLQLNLYLQDEKNQVMTTNVWLRQQWIDYKLKWNPDDYGGVSVLYVPPKDIWLPDIVLYDNADGNFHVTLMTKATVRYTGEVTWEPPAIYKSSCTIDVEFFPFDEQTCSMKFSSWTYDGFQLDLQHSNQNTPEDGVIENAIDMTGYYRSFIWDVMSVRARRNVVFYPCCPESYPDVTFHITIRRKTLFYTVNLIIPCVAISFLTVLVFFVPSDSGEKITLCISILLSLTVFFLLLSDLIPPTSLVVPLIGKYLLFTMILVTLSIIVTVVVLSVHFRSPKTHTMPPWVRKVFIHILPQLLMMKRPIFSRDRFVKTIRIPGANRKSDTSSVTTATNSRRASSRSVASSTRTPMIAVSTNTTNVPLTSASVTCGRSDHSPEIVRAMECIDYITDRLQDKDVEIQIKEDWKYVAMVIDRLFLWIFTTACIVGTFGIILQAPTLYDDKRPMDLSQIRL